MHKLSLLLLLCLSLHVITPAQRLPQSRAGNVSPASDYQTQLSEILSQVVTDDGLVDYNLLSTDLATPFQEVLKAIEEYDLNTLHSEAEKMAFWINAYNVQMLQNIVQYPRVRNIINAGMADAFFKRRFRTGGMAISLDEIENIILRKQKGRDALEPYQVKVLDPRIHVGLNCAAVSCPALRKTAYTADNVYSELNEAMTAFVNSSQHFNITDSSITLSSILEWFGADFTVNLADFSAYEALPELDANNLNREPIKTGDFLWAYVNETNPQFALLEKLLRGKTASELVSTKRVDNKVVNFDYNWKVNRN